MILSYVILTVLVVGAWIRTFRLQDQIDTLRRQLGGGGPSSTPWPTKSYAHNRPHQEDGT